MWNGRLRRAGVRFLPHYDTNVLTRHEFIIDAPSRVPAARVHVEACRHITAVSFSRESPRSSDRCAVSGICRRSLTGSGRFVAGGMDTDRVLHVRVSSDAMLEWLGITIYPRDEHDLRAFLEVQTESRLRSAVGSMSWRRHRVALGRDRYVTPHFFRESEFLDRPPIPLTAILATYMP